MAGVIRYWSRMNLKFSGLSNALFRGNAAKMLALSSIGTRYRKRTVNEHNMILITGCDSGVGFNMAIYCNLKLNMFVCATCLNSSSEGARKLVEQCDPKRLFLVELDIRKHDSILRVENTIMDLINDRDLEFSYLVNNAGLMCFGEFEWQTNDIIEHQIHVNLLGTMKFTKSLLHLVRKHKTRIINVTSHCALEALPGLSTYAATKAGLKFWNDALRVEMKQYGVQVVNFIPGSYVMSTNITERQMEYTAEMLAAFTDEQRTFYGDYFERYNNYVNLFSGTKPVEIFSDGCLLTEFRNAIIDYTPRAMYKCEPLRYTIYHCLFKYCPVFVRDWLIIKFIRMPTYKN